PDVLDFEGNIIARPCPGKGNRQENRQFPLADLSPVSPSASHDSVNERRDDVGFAEERRQCANALPVSMARAAAVGIPPRLAARAGMLRKRKTRDVFAKPAKTPTVGKPGVPPAAKPHLAGRDGSGKICR
ncbi:MAG: hypothetical protein OXD29_00095, partial [Roseovarius sp.]|nr:hypothetical protein [Roseovarius sp.]